MLIPNAMQMIALLIASLLFCIMGFKKFVWFLSVGYGLSVAGIGGTLLVLTILAGNWNILLIVQCVLFVVYGLRLGLFILIRELKNEKYRAKLTEAGGDAKVPVFVAFFGWILCAVLYLAQTSPAIYRLGNGTEGISVWQIAGCAVSALGMTLEALSDKQKSAQKEKNPNMPAMEGLFKMCRCPNYFGEIVFWTGVFISGIDTLTGWQWLVASLGYVCIFYIMINGAQRLERRHIKHYGSDPAYIAYADKTPILIPLLPIYHLVKADK